MISRPQRHLRESDDDAGPILTPSDPPSPLLDSPPHLLDSPNVLPYEAMRCRLCEVGEQRPCHVASSRHSPLRRPPRLPLQHCASMLLWPCAIASTAMRLLRSLSSHLAAASHHHALQCRSLVADFAHAIALGSYECPSSCMQHESIARRGE